MTPSASARLKALLAVILWGGSLPSLKVAVSQASVPTVLWLRFGTAVLVLFVFLALRKKLRLLSLRETLIFAALGFIGVFFHNSVQGAALQSLSAGMSGLIVAANPIAIALLGALILGERLNGRKIAGILLAAFGVLVIMSKGNLSVFSGRGFAPGEILMVLSVFSWGLFSVLSRKALQNSEPALAMGYALLFGWLYSFLPFFWTEGYREIPAIAPSGWANILYLGVFCSAAAYLFWYDALRELPVSVVGVFMYVNPVVAVFLSVLLLGEPLTFSMIAGGSLVFLGVWFVNRSRR